MKKHLVIFALLALVLSGCSVSGGGSRHNPSPSHSSTSETEPIVSRVLLNKNKLSFNINQNEEYHYSVEQLHATLEYEGTLEATLEWASSNTGVVTVENGLVHAVGVGDAIVTVGAVIGGSVNAYATCSVNVVDVAPTVESILITPDNPVIDLCNDNELQLKATVIGTNNPRGDVTWRSLTEDFEIDENGLITATKTGVAIFEATSVLDDTKSTTISVRIIDTTPTVNMVQITYENQPVEEYTLDINPYLNPSKKSVQFDADVETSYGASEAVTWSSDDSNIVEVDENGLVTAKAVTNGVCITVRSNFDQSKYSSVMVDVIDTTPRVDSVVVSLDKTTLSVNKTAQATAVVNGKYLEAEHKTVSWSSSDESVATIDSTGLITAKSIGETTIKATANFVNDGEQAKTDEIKLTVSNLDAYTIMMYICGSDLESNDQSAAASGDIKEILAATNMQPENVNIILETGGTTKWHSINGVTPNKSKLERFEVNQNQIVLKESLTCTNMGAPSTLQSFIEWGINEYPADKMAIIFWNHGGGITGCCFDDNANGDGLTPTEIGTAFKGAFQNTGYTEKFEWIGYDCCLKQNIEEAAINRAYANYQVAAQISENGDGWYYTPWVSELYANPQIETGTLLTKICDTFVNFYNNSPYVKSENTQTLSWLYLDRVDTFLDAFNTFTKGFNTQDKFNDVKDAAESALTYDDSYCCYDLLGVMKNLNATDAVLNSITNLVGYFKYIEGARDEYGISYIKFTPGGVNVFVATSGFYVEKSLYNSVASEFGDWKSMNYSYGFSSWW